MVSADTAAQRWVSGLSGATQKITEGIAAVTVAPGQAAARQRAVYVANVTAAAETWARNVGRVTLSDWQQASTTKGVPRIASGAQQAQSKMQQVMTKLLPAIDSAVKSLPPRGTFEQNVARSTAMMTKLHSQAGQFSA